MVRADPTVIVACARERMSAMTSTYAVTSPWGVVAVIVARYAIVRSENRDAYTDDRLSFEGGVEIVVRAWPEDEAWGETGDDGF